MLFTVLMIYGLLAAKRKDYLINTRIQKILDPWISRALLEDSLVDYRSYITAGVLRYLKNAKNRQFTIEQLIDSRKNLTGLAADNIIKLYTTLELDNDSIRKLHSKVWHNKAKGIYELYMMNQVRMQDEILKYTNSKNEYLRMEAQTAIIGFLGFDGLSFLNTLTNPLTEWQQIKLLEQLKTLNLVDEIAYLSDWLDSSNETVVLFALKLTDIYQQMQVHSHVVNCLKSNNEKVRRQAIKTLARIADDTTVNILIRHYEEETQGNKKAILRNMAIIAQDTELDFFLAQLQDPDDNLKLEAAIAISKSMRNWQDILQKQISLDPDVYGKIYLHAQNKLLA